MKAAVLRAPGGLDRIEVQDIPDPSPPGPGQIRIALHATSQLPRPVGRQWRPPDR